MPHDVARELRQRLPQAGDLKVHKLAYYCQGWHLARTGEPLFHEPIEAWTNGPVVAELWHDEKRNRHSPLARRLSDQHVAVVEYVVHRYGAFTGRELVRKTHLENPWRDVSETDDDAWVTANPEITHAALRAWFSADEDYLAHTAAVTKLRERRDVYGFEGPGMPDDLRDATLRMLSDGRSGFAAG